jgi:hypothetical protein
MAKQIKSASAKRSTVSVNGTAKEAGKPRSLGIAEKGVRTSIEFAALMSAMMSDIIASRMTPEVGNATCNAGGKLLKVVEMQYKYGQTRGRKGTRALILAR